MSIQDSLEPPQRNEGSEQHWRLSATAALAKIRDKSLTVEDYARSMLSRVTQRQSKVHAWVYVNEELVLQQARALDQIPFEDRGPIHGLPIGVKDIMLTKDMPTQYNSRMYQSDKPIEIDAAPVAILRANGALIFGKLTTTEFASTPQGDWHQNHTANPCDPTRTPGGSSSGSGAAVADFQVPIALGTQTGGSIIRPSSFTGVLGWKPTWGAISREGLAQWCISLDTCGFFARSLEDMELMADVFRLDPYKVKSIEAMRCPKIAFCQTPSWDKTGPGTREAMRKAKLSLEADGAECSVLQLPKEFESVLAWHADIMAGEGKVAFLSHYLKDKTLMHDQLRAYIEHGRSMSGTQLCQAYDGCAVLRSVWDDIAQSYDAVVVPSVPDEAPLGLEHTGDMSLCSMWTALHCPAINVPAFKGSHGLPVGLTLVGPRYSDRALLHMAGYVQTIWTEAENMR